MLGADTPARGPCCYAADVRPLQNDGPSERRGAASAGRYHPKQCNSNIAIKNADFAKLQLGLAAALTEREVDALLREPLPYNWMTIAVAAFKTLATDEPVKDGREPALMS